MCPGGTVFCAPGVPPDSWMPCGWGSGAWVEGGALRGPSYLTECHITALVSPFCRPRERGHSCEAACPLTRTHWVLVWVRRPLGPEEPAARTDRVRVGPILTGGFSPSFWFQAPPHPSLDLDFSSCGPFPPSHPAPPTGVCVCSPGGGFCVCSLDRGWGGGLPL